MTTWKEVKSNIKSLSAEELAEIEALARLQAYIIKEKNISPIFKETLIKLIKSEIEAVE